MNKIFYIFTLIFPLYCFSQYTGTASVTKGLASTTATNLYSCNGGRITNLGSIKAMDNSMWIVPALVNFTNGSFPFASDLHNVCIGANYLKASDALAALNGSDVVTIDSMGEIITAFIFADNYFEMYINGIPVGKDKVPYTQFNSSIVRFKVKKPFTIAMLLVDWEENLGLGSELNGGSPYHCGDGGLVAVFKDSQNKTIAVTGNDWKAQTFYTSPIKDLTCPTESGAIRYSDKCDTKDSNDGRNYYGLHWNRPANWMETKFDDSKWPSATTYTNASIGVDNKPAYTNFTSIFDDPANDAQFIWSTNVVLDNEVIVRYTVNSITSILDQRRLINGIAIYPNPASREFNVEVTSDVNVQEIRAICLYNAYGEKKYESNSYTGKINIEYIPKGFYLVQIEVADCQIIKKLLIQ